MFLIVIRPYFKYSFKIFLFFNTLWENLSTFTSLVYLIYLFIYHGTVHTPRRSAISLNGVCLKPDVTIGRQNCNVDTTQ